MLRDDSVGAEDSLSRVNKACKLITIVVKTVFVIFCICWLTSLFAMIYSSFSSGVLDNGEGLGLLRPVLYFAHGFTISLIFVVLIKVFSDTAEGQSPFVMNQAKRLRLIAGLLIMYAVLDALVSYNLGLVQYDGLNSGYVSTNEAGIIPINLAPIIGSAVTFAFSFVFKYGVLLQELSDETL